MANQIYQKLSQLEHVLQRPNSYIGSVESDTTNMWVMNDDKTHMEERPIKYSPGLYKIFDEILVNAIDQSFLDNMVDTIKVWVDYDTGSVTVQNNGKGIPIEIHEKEKIYIPELIFGNLLTSSNYDDTKKRTTGGVNGLGSKLANIFSTNFHIEIHDTKHKKKYIQSWENNMKKVNNPKIAAFSGKQGMVKFTFTPDYPRFGIEKMTKDVFYLFEKRTYDVCACTNSKIKVYFNDIQLNIKTFEKYVDLYGGNKSQRVTEKTENWDVAVEFSPDGFKQISFVNGISTSHGGTHVDHVVKGITSKLMDIIASKNKGLVVKAPFIKDHIRVFVKSTLVNPSFSSQSKTECTSKVSSFGSKFEPSEDFYKKIGKTGITDEVIALSKHKEMRELGKTDGKKRSNIKGIPKLDDANKAGTLQSKKCTLVLTEGDSAKTFAISGLSVVGRDHWGVFPLRGKLLNARDATVKNLTGNAEISALKQILGLQQGKVYKSTGELRYGRVMILTDADVDGSHIKGLIMNFLHAFWPSILEIDPGFVCAMITPIVKATKGNQTKRFYNLPEFDEWKKTSEYGKSWNIKYYKGLGTSTGAEAKEYFKELELNTVKYITNTNTEIPNKDCMELAFKKDYADKRKTWILEGIDRKETLPHDQKRITFDEFINKDLIWFSIADLRRSIPSMVDGLKPSQRKVLHACRKRPNNRELKVSQLAGYVSTETCYHHGEASLTGAIVGMAQNFVGSNGINLLNPNGQFGTRLMGGKDSASPRYIFTNLSKNGQELFKKQDDAVLNYLDDDGFKIEPEYFVPTLPMVLINGAEGIGTGYSTSIPCYNHEDVKEQLKRVMNGKEPEKIHPWYKNFNGTIIEKEPGQYTVSGCYKVLGRKCVEITELPIGKWTDDYKSFLESISEGVAKKPIIESYENNSTEDKVNFTLYFNADILEKFVKTKTLEKELKLTTNMSTKNMHLFDANNNIKKYHNVGDIIKDFAKVRLEYYDKRKEYMLKTMKNETNILSEKIRFIKMVCDDKITVFRRKKNEIIEDLKTHKFKKMNDCYDYLIGMKLYFLTEENIKEYEDKYEEIKKTMKDLENKTAKDLWAHEL